VAKRSQLLARSHEALQGPAHAAAPRGLRGSESLSRLVPLWSEPSDKAVARLSQPRLLQRRSKTAFT